jgi:hypothetical protein
MSGTVFSDYMYNKSLLKLDENTSCKVRIQANSNFYYAGAVAARSSVLTKGTTITNDVDGTGEFDGIEVVVTAGQTVNVPVNNMTSPLQVQYDPGDGTGWNTNKLGTGSLTFTNTYATAGTYVIKFRTWLGETYGLGFGSSTSKTAFTRVTNFSPSIRIGNTFTNFVGLTNLTAIVAAQKATAEANCSYLFDGC